ncbi:MAG: NAD-dependent epimerase/dehydratase family protein [Bacteroidales bacterium]|nr:NAD-dependent epimerase/dehydratase family protein [Bacteroidales bacterium]
MKVLLLGGTGLLGNNVWRLLLGQGHEVTLLVRERGKIDWRDVAEEQRRRTAVIEGSMLDAASLFKAATGCEAMVNCTGCTDMGLLRYEDYLPANRDICRLLVETMERSGTSRLVHVSTANTVGYGTPERVADENEPMGEPFASSFYAKSKKEGEVFLQNYAARHPEKHVVIVCPGFMVGGYDTKPSSGKLLLAAYRKPLMVCTKGGKSFVHVKDVATATANAIWLGTSGKKYLLTGDNLSMEEFYALEARVMGYRQHMVRLPNWVALAVAKVGDALRYAGVGTQLSTNNVRQLLIREYYDASSSVSELKMPRTSLEEAIKDFFARRGKGSG